MARWGIVADNGPGKGGGLYNGNLISCYNGDGYTVRCSAVLADHGNVVEVSVLIRLLHSHYTPLYKQPPANFAGCEGAREVLYRAIKCSTEHS